MIQSRRPHDNTAVASTDAAHSARAAATDQLFDRTWYLQQYPDANESGLDALDHYRTIGVKLGYDPHPLFDTCFYLDQYPDVRESEANPFDHFIDFGAVEGRYPNLLFDTPWYLSTYPEVKATGVNPLLDYLRKYSEGREPNPYFNSAEYLEQHSDAERTGINPLLHLATSSRAEAFGIGRKCIQINRRGGIGDILLVTPIAAALRKQYPDHQIVLTTDFPELLRNNPHIDRIFKLRHEIRGVTRFIDLNLAYESDPEVHIVDAYAKLAGVDVHDRTPQIFLTQDERAAANQLLRDTGIRPYQRFCVMQITSGWEARNWPVSKFLELANELEREDVRVLILGEKPEPPVAFGIDLRGKTDIRMAAAIIEKCSSMVTVDSSLMHIAYAFRRPVVAVFGCTDPEKRVPAWAIETAIYSDVVCRGCLHRQRPAPVTTAPTCPWDSYLCMDQIATSKVLASAKQQLAAELSPLVSIIIPHYYRYDLLHNCLTSLFSCGASVQFEVVVVANGSPETSLSNLESWRPRISVVALHPNMGFSHACNAGVRAARGKYVIVLNDDTTVTPGWLENLIEPLADSSIGVTGPKLLYPQNNGIQHCGTVFNERGFGEHIFRHLPHTYAAANRPRYYRALTGACLALRRDTFLMVGGFDTSFHGTGGCEDTDLCFKLLDLNMRVLYWPSSVVYHHEGLTRGLRDEDHPEDTYNRRILRERWGKYLSSDISDYCLLAEIESLEGREWPWLGAVPPEVVARYDVPDRRLTGRSPFRLQLGTTAARDGYLRLAGGASTLAHISYEWGAPLPFMDQSVSEIWTHDLCSNVPLATVIATLRECYRVLLAAGRLIVAVPSLCEMTDEADGSVERTEEGLLSLNRRASSGLADALLEACYLAGFAEVSIRWWADAAQSEAPGQPDSGIRAHVLAIR